ncbi:hypothetical protein OEZ85_012260 [Tetradesmus obliquus]|uniref:Small acidic protein-like domain-containing protein n=1 Tax=Tetradesmus obliquus TaxID=3088 RepID=A0ABY8TST5_TETOB|nr:hypothetical protein OEZ85_012260 [Tetradesmus obliquus]
MMQGAAGAAGGFAASSALDRQQKAKMLWGAKKDAAAAGIVPATGNNRWEAAEFGDSQQKMRFQRLMGAHPGQQQQQQQQQGAAERCDDVDGVSAPRVMGRQQQARVLADVERQFLQGLKRADGRTVGLGL